MYTFAIFFQLSSRDSVIKFFKTCAFSFSWHFIRHSNCNSCYMASQPASWRDGVHTVYSIGYILCLDATLSGLYVRAHTWYLLDSNTTYMSPVPHMPPVPLLACRVSYYTGQSLTYVPSCPSTHPGAVIINRARTPTDHPINFNCPPVYIEYISFRLTNPLKTNDHTYWPVVLRIKHMGGGPGGGGAGALWVCLHADSP